MNKTKAFVATAFTILLLAGGYNTALAQQTEDGKAPTEERGGTMHEMVKSCPMMKDEAMMRQMIENCPMMKEMMAHMKSCPMMKDRMMGDGMSHMEDDTQGHEMHEEHAMPMSEKGLAVPEAAQVFADASAMADEARPQVIKITVGPDGFEPTQIQLMAGVPAQFIFTRTTDATCAKQIQAPEVGIKRADLPLNESVTVAFTPEETGTFTFACGMGMMKGTVVVKS